MRSSPERVVAAMSGGVDSSTAAAIMKERGFEVIGVTLKLWSCDLDPGGMAPPGRACCGEAGITDARTVAEAMGIEHHVLDYRAEFVQRVVHASRDVQAGGMTPNPCVLCNEHMKFGLLMDWARERGASRVVTGHYARVERTGERAGLLRGKDRSKDQSYFLFTLAGDPRLSMLEFPCGGMTKGEVRKRAGRMGLAVAGKSESQDLCFPVVDRQADRPGEIVDAGGRLMGRHEGLSRFTVGQRKGVGIAGKERLYVIALRPEENRVVVGGEDDLLRREVRARLVAWNGPLPEGPLEAAVKIRYRHDPAPGSVRWEDGDLVVAFDELQRAVTPGQALVCYVGEKVLGGGWIGAAYSMGGP